MKFGLFDKKKVKFQEHNKSVHLENKSFES